MPKKTLDVKRHFFRVGAQKRRPTSEPRSSQTTVLCKWPGYQIPILTMRRSRIRIRCQIFDALISMTPPMAPGPDWVQMLQSHQQRMSHQGRRMSAETISRRPRVHRTQPAESSITASSMTHPLLDLSQPSAHTPHRIWRSQPAKRSMGLCLPALQT